MCVVGASVIAADGQTYERVPMEAWLAEQGPCPGPLRSPATGELLPHDRLLPNLAVRALLQDA